MSRFFINRPIFAWVLAIIVMAVGVLSVMRLPISQYPSIAGPSIVISASYPGASAETAADTVVQIIEKEMTGLDGLRYINSSTTSTGQISITLTFRIGTDPDIAQVQVQNKLAQAEAGLPETVTRQGVTVEKSATGFLMIVGLVSNGGAQNAIDLADYLSSNLVEPISRLDGVGKVQVFGSEYAMRIWLDPLKLKYYDLSPATVIAAIRAQNAQISAEAFGAMPAPEGQELNATITAQSLLKTPEDFERIVLRADTDGGLVLLRDVARAELGAETYEISGFYNGKPAAAMAVQLASGANALDTAELVKAKIEELSRDFPAGTSYVIPYDTTPFVLLSIEAVVETLIEAIALVVLVILVFLHNFRATLIPTLAVPVVLLGTFGIMASLGFTINTLTMLAMVLAIGLLVDDAIVVVENVERIMQEEAIGPKEATEKSMGEISGALVGIAMVVSAVFVPMAFFGGATGEMYKQFAVTIVSAMGLSVLVALIFTPALCATMLKPHAHGAKRQGILAKLGGGFSSWFERNFGRMTSGYTGLVRFATAHTISMLLIYAVIVAGMAALYLRTPTSFLPDEDQGSLITIVQLPSGATAGATEKVLRKVEDYWLKGEAANAEAVFLVRGFSFGGQGQNMGLLFTKLKDWSARTTAESSVKAIAGRAFGPLFFGINEAMVVPFAPPAVLELGTSNGFSAYLQASSGKTHEELLAARNMLLGMAAQDPMLSGVRPSGVEDAPQFRLNIDWAKAGAVGVAADVGTFLNTIWSSAYVNDFLYQGRVKRVFVQGEPAARLTPEDLALWRVQNVNGDFVDFSTFATQEWVYGPQQVTRYNAMPSMGIDGTAAPGFTSGDAIAAMEALATKLPPGFSLQWTGMSLEEKEAGAGAMALYGLALAAVFLCLAALYESWTIPIVVLLAMPVGVLGALIGGQSNGVYFQVGLLTVVGLTGKNGIMIVEFARERMASLGESAVEAVTQAARQRFRPILMTSLAFGLGVVPLVLSTGAGAGAREAIGYATLFGTMTGTALAIIFVPVFFVLINRLFSRGQTKAPIPATAA